MEEGKARYGTSNAMYGIFGLQPWHNISGIGKGFHGRHSEETKLKIGLANLKNSTNYWALHKWVVRKKGKAFGCFHCGTTENRRYEWANISGEYKRELDDYESLCVPCHRRKDGTNKFGKYRRM